MYETDIPAQNYGRGFTQGSVKLFSDSNTTSRPNIPIRMHYNESSKEGRIRNEEIFPSGTQVLSNLFSGCGHEFATFRRIVGGHESVIGAWPWMALIYHIRRGREKCRMWWSINYSKTYHYCCSLYCECKKRGQNGVKTMAFGTGAETSSNIEWSKSQMLLILLKLDTSNRMLPRQLMVRLGEHDLHSDKEGAVHMDFAVHSVIKFDAFDIRTFQNDVAILLLNTTVQFEKHISPICIPFNIFNGEDLSTEMLSPQVGELLVTEDQRAQNCKKCSYEYGTILNVKMSL
ncbi:CLIP domain-containing serine protease [Caerostris extrusa]|uniref:CLIP domain-containing serine protease n=1 Tax=Caerostris extrusa TaxID=172846 RepID=A0AAV4SIT9_CAEEX|nr:CLIP domain-containing serine protease [Caerostris extrusa]